MEKREQFPAYKMPKIKIKKWYYCDEGLHLKDVLEWVWEERLTRATAEKILLRKPRTWPGSALLPSCIPTFSVPIRASREIGKSVHSMNAFFLCTLYILSHFIHKRAPYGAGTIILYFIHEKAKSQRSESTANKL